jgi:hypothetical protein
VDFIILLGGLMAEMKKDAWFWTKEWQAGEKEADEDFNAGRYQNFSNVNDLIAYLKASEMGARVPTMSEVGTDV